MSGAEVVAAIAAAASAVVTAGAAIQQGDAARKSANYQAALAENNAIAARQEAERVEREHREKTRRQLSANRARFAKGGVLPEEGSPLLFNIDGAEGAEIDGINIRQRGETDAANFRAEAGFNRFEGRVAQRQAYLRATSSLLSGVSDAAGRFGKASPTKPSGGAGGSVPMTQDVHDFLYETGAWGPG